MIKSYRWKWPITIYCNILVKPAIDLEKEIFRFTTCVSPFKSCTCSGDCYFAVRWLRICSTKAIHSDFDSEIQEWPSLYSIEFFGFKWLLNAYVLNFDNSIPKVTCIQVKFIFWKLDVGWFYHFGWFVRILSSDKNQTIIIFFILGKVMDKNLIVLYRLDTSEYPEFFFH